MACLSWLWLYPTSILFFIGYTLHLLTSTSHKASTAKKVYYLSLLSGALWMIFQWAQHASASRADAGLFILLTYFFASVMISLITLTSLILARAGRILKALSLLPVLFVFLWIPFFEVRRTSFGWAAQPNLFLTLWTLSLVVPAMLLSYTYSVFKKWVNDEVLRKRSCRFAMYSLLLLVTGTAYYAFAVTTLLLPFFSPVPVIAYLVLTYPLFGGKKRV